MIVDNNRPTLLAYLWIFPSFFGCNKFGLVTLGNFQSWQFQKAHFPPLCWSKSHHFYHSSLLYHYLWLRASFGSSVVKRVSIWYMWNSCRLCCGIPFHSFAQVGLHGGTTAQSGYNIIQTWRSFSLCIYSLMDDVYNCNFLLYHLLYPSFNVFA
jgi:hypothetical protein